ncbi:MAG: D-alanyl-D-alanine carboxypeptidase family protein [Rhizobiales bacterium]|nr:D-alanyl-D-alanine carboxypeptidase family protein [Hyphomicrobiales bacterium]MBI3674126.1 D-alanyl-D-alanine carboxypeptidase family protein [Hyphomicrobiales bacterium]
MADTPTSAHTPMPAGSAAGFGLDSGFAVKLQQLLDICRQAKLDFRISQGLRTPQVQAQYFCRWEKHPADLIDRKIAMLADNGAPWLASLLNEYRDVPRQKAFLTGQLPGSGWHQWGLAADCYCYRNDKMIENGSDPVYARYAKEAVKLGLTAGYYFKDRDAGHVQNPAEPGADSVYTWSYIDRVMQERFAEKTVVALPASAKKALAAASKMRPTTAVSNVPPEAKESDITVSGSSVLGPGGLVFGKLHKLGLYNGGATSIDQFFSYDPGAFPGVSPSLQRVIRSVSINEGKIEAINTWDNAILSCGIFQWTLAAGGEAGELAGLLELLQQRSPTAFQSYFGSLGLTVAMNASPAGALRRGYLVLNGKKLDNAVAKTQMREHIWAYRFWRAAHDTEVRRAQVALAMSRVGAFFGGAIAAAGGKTFADCITSEMASPWYWTSMSTGRAMCRQHSIARSSPSSPKPARRIRLNGRRPTSATFFHVIWRSGPKPT